MSEQNADTVGMSEDDAILAAISEALFDAEEHGEVSVDRFLLRLRERGFEVRRATEQQYEGQPYMSTETGFMKRGPSTRNDGDVSGS